MGKERLRYVDIARGIGIIAVLCSHAGIWTDWICIYYMPMFFATSGCIFQFLGRNGVDICIKSAKKIVRLYFVYSLVVGILYIPLFFIKNNNSTFLIRNIIGVFYARKALFSPLGLEENVIFMEYGNGPMWFLPCLAIAWILLFQYI